MRNTASILEDTPDGADTVAQWFATMDHKEFDSVCVSAVTLTLEDENVANRFISLRSVSIMLCAMRDRYRREIAYARFEHTGGGIMHRSLNDWQVRIIRRIPGNKHGLGNREVARMFHSSRSVVQQIRSERTAA